MLITTAGADPYALVVSPNGHELGLPFIFRFQKGLFYLEELCADRSTNILFNSVHREHLLAYYTQAQVVWEILTNLFFWPTRQKTQS